MQIQHAYLNYLYGKHQPLKPKHSNRLLQAAIHIIWVLTLQCPIFAQTTSTSINADSVKTSIQIPVRFYQTVSTKADKYYDAVTAKTEKTLIRLAKWESKIKILLQRVNPQAAERLFANDQLSFASMLQRFKEGKIRIDGYRASYNEHRDKLTTSLNYLGNNVKLADSITKQLQSTAKNKMEKLNAQLDNSAAMEQMIRDRKKQLIHEAIQFVGKNKSLQKINKETFYYAETLRNYKEIFSDPKKAEEAALRVLQKIPAFNAFMKRNSMLASLFRLPGNPDDPSSGARLAGLQTRAQVNGLIQQQISAGGVRAQQRFQENLQSAQSELSNLKAKLIKPGSGNGGGDLPDFKPNEQRSKTFLQRLEYNANFQSQRSTNFFPSTTDIGLSAGYKLNDKSIIGIGASYKMGLGRGWDHLRLTHEGIGLRTYVDLKLKGSFWISGGYEQNYRSAFKNIVELKNKDAWQISGLIGISKTVSIKSQFFKKTSVKLLWDFLSYRQVPRAQAVLFRIGYSF